MLIYNAKDELNNACNFRLPLQNKEATLAAIIFFNFLLTNHAVQARINKLKQAALILFNISPTDQQIADQQLLIAMSSGNIVKLKIALCTQANVNIKHEEEGPYIPLMLVLFARPHLYTIMSDRISLSCFCEKGLQYV